MKTRGPEDQKTRRLEDRMHRAQGAELRAKDQKTRRPAETETPRHQDTETPRQKMASILPGYNYDIFISYRQKDNKHDGWVTEFVDNLKGELESTFKEEISVYFDINPHDGLLETHDVDASLKEKLKCLIFIPIISRTYCDPKSFAWEHEFNAFVEMASKDQFGLKVKLPNGNVANRVLPIQIHDIDTEDRKLCESCLGAFLRGIEFIYKEPGIDRPLTTQDNEGKNLNRTNYRNQINKVALAIRDILTGFSHHEQKSEQEKAVPHDTTQLRVNHSRNKLLAGFSVVLVMIIAGILLVPKLIRPEEQTDKSIAILPFVNMSNDPAQEYFCDGIMQEIVNNLFMIGGLDIPPTTSSMRYKESKLTPREIARELNVSYLLEGSVNKSDNHVRVTVRLIDGKTEKMRWSQPYDFDITATDLINLQSDVAQKVAKSMDVAMQTSLKERISYLPTQNTEAYDLFLKAKNLNYNLTSKILLEKAIELDPSFSDAFAELAYYYIWNGGHHGTLTSEEVLANSESLVRKALEINMNCITAHQALATMSLLYKWDFKTVEKEHEIIRQLNPSNPAGSLDDYLLATCKFSDALNIGQELEAKHRNYSSYWIQMALAYCFNDQVENAKNALEKAWKIEGYSDFLCLNTVRIYDNLGLYREAFDLYHKYYRKDNPYYEEPIFWSYYGIAAFKTGNRNTTDSCLKKLLLRSESTAVGSPYFFTAALYTAMAENDKAIAMLEKAFKNREVEMYWLKSEPLFRPLHGDKRYENILSRMGFER